MLMELSYSVYLDKVHGGWIGKCIGGAVGFLQENNKSLMDYTLDNVFPDHIPPNDDLDLQILYLQEVLEKRGSFFSAGDLADAFARYNLCLANEYAMAIKNIELGIEPPLSGVFNNDYFRNSMGCPIRSEIWGFINPGRPDSAVRYAQMDGSVDHDSESIEGEKFYAALEAICFVESDLNRLIASGLKTIPEQSKVARCIRFVQALYESGVDWKAARKQLVRNFGSADASYSVVNIGLAILALLFGGGDFTNTMLIAVNCGYDTDCTAATAGAILGVIAGAQNIPRYWKDKIGEDVVIGTVSIRRYSEKIIDLAKDTCAAGLSLARDGVHDVRFTDIPAGVAPSLPVPEPVPPVAIAIDYDGHPSIGYGESKRVTLTVTNLSREEVNGTLSFALPDSLTANVQQVELRVPRHGAWKTEVLFEVKKDIVSFPQKNRITAIVRHNGATLAEKAFGLSGAARVKVIGPFWDNYDTTIFDQDPYKDLMQRKPDGSPDLFAMFNGFVDIHRPYMDESFVAIDQSEGEYVNLHEDRINVSDLVGYEGPCCVYLVHEFICPESRTSVSLTIGHSEAYKLWLNRELVANGSDSAMWTPCNRDVGVTLRKGVNEVIVKLLRKGRGCDFSYLMRNAESKLHWFVDLEHVIHPDDIE